MEDNTALDILTPAPAMEVVKALKPKRKYTRKAKRKYTRKAKLVVKKAKTVRRGRPKGSKNKAKRVIRNAQAVMATQQVQDKQALIAALGLILVAADLLRQQTN